MRRLRSHFARGESCVETNFHGICTKFSLLMRPIREARDPQNTWCNDRRANFHLAFKFRRRCERARSLVTRVLRTKTRTCKLNMTRLLKNIIIIEIKYRMLDKSSILKSRAKIISFSSVLFHNRATC